MTPLFIANEQFDPRAGARWDDYIRWAKIPNLIEVVSIDSMLCPRLATELIAEESAPSDKFHSVT
jgi:hypothetical protein